MIILFTACNLLLKYFHCVGHYAVNAFMTSSSLLLAIFQIQPPDGTDTGTYVTLACLHALPRPNLSFYSPCANNLCVFAVVFSQFYNTVDDFFLDHCPCQ